MGTIDQTGYRLSCAKCNTEELALVLDKGSGWGGSHWQSGASFSGFETSWTGGAAQEPKLISATCEHCRFAAKVVSGYGVI
jgi:hypothetical protein